MTSLFSLRAVPLSFPLCSARRGSLTDEGFLRVCSLLRVAVSKVGVCVRVHACLRAENRVSALNRGKEREVNFLVLLIQDSSCHKPLSSPITSKVFV